MVLGDGRQLERLLMNLVTNAVKFTPPGGRIMVSSSVSADSVVLSVTDTGIGIPLAEQEAVFGRFFRGSEATQEVIPGTGLGLAIVQAIVEHHGGTLTLRSAPGEGTTVRVRLPSIPAAGAGPELQAQGAADGADRAKEDLVPVGVQASVGSRRPWRRRADRSTQQGAPQMTTAMSPDQLAGTTRVLIIEDDPSIAEAVRRVVAKQNGTGVVAADGRNGLRNFFEERPDLVVLDIGLPGWTAGRCSSASATSPRYPC